MGFSVHLGEVTNGMFLDPLALSCVVSHSYSASFVFLCQSLPQKFAGRERVVRSCSLGGNIWSQNVRFHFCVTEHFYASQTVCKRSASVRRMSSSEVTKVPLAESRRLLVVMESKSESAIKKKDMKRK